MPGLNRPSSRTHGIFNAVVCCDNDSRGSYRSSTKKGSNQLHLPGSLSFHRIMSVKNFLRNHSRSQGVAWDLISLVKKYEKLSDFLFILRLAMLLVVSQHHYHLWIEKSLRSLAHILTGLLLVVWVVFVLAMLIHSSSDSSHNFLILIKLAILKLSFCTLEHQ